MISSFFNFLKQTFSFSEEFKELQVEAKSLRFLKGFLYRHIKASLYSLPDTNEEAKLLPFFIYINKIEKSIFENRKKRLFFWYYQWKKKEAKND